MKTQQPLFRFSWLLFVIVIMFPARPASADLVAKLPQVLNPFFITIADGRG